jgi:hypothetical protein
MLQGSLQSFFGVAYATSQNANYGHTRRRITIDPNVAGIAPETAPRPPYVPMSLISPAVRVHLRISNALIVQKMQAQRRSTNNPIGVLAEPQTNAVAPETKYKPQSRHAPMSKHRFNTNIGTLSLSRKLPQAAQLHVRAFAFSEAASAGKNQHAYKNLLQANYAR